MILEGIPIFLCDEGAVGFLVRRFRRVDYDSMGFTPVSSRTAVVATLQVVSPTSILAVVSVDLANVIFVVLL